MQPFKAYFERFCSLVKSSKMPIWIEGGIWLNRPSSSSGGVFKRLAELINSWWCVRVVNRRNIKRLPRAFDGTCVGEIINKKAQIRCCYGQKNEIKVRNNALKGTRLVIIIDGNTNILSPFVHLKCWVSRTRGRHPQVEGWSSAADDERACTEHAVYCAGERRCM